MNNLTETAAQLWAKLYPERRPWAELEPETRAEWVRFVEACAEILSKTLTNKLMDNKNIDQNSEAQGRLPDVASYAVLTLSERRQIAEVLERRSNDIASFKSDLEEKISTEAGKRIRFQDFPGSVEMALSREIGRLRRLAEKIKPVSVEEDDDDA